MSSLNLTCSFVIYIFLHFLILTQCAEKKSVQKIHKPKTFHLLGVAHTKTTKDYLACPFTQKVYKLCLILKSLGHYVIHYGAEGSEEGICSEHVTVVSDEIQKKVYGHVDWKKGDPWEFHPDDEANKAFQENAIREIVKRKRQDDILLATHGTHHRPVVAGVGLPLSVEFGVGFSGTYPGIHRVWESAAWMHWINSREGEVEGRWYDVVIPPAFDPNDFQFIDRSGKEDYFLYVGRLNYDKGIDIAAKVAQKLGYKLKVVGQGELSTALDLNAYKSTDTIEYIGVVSTAQARAELMGKAKALFLPTYYFEPFGYVVIEANLCGTPVITTDWGAFRENVLHGVSGFRCHTLGEFIRAGELVDSLDPKQVRKWAEENFSIEKLKHTYDLYFDRIQNLGWGLGWDSDYVIPDADSFLTRDYRLVGSELKASKPSKKASKKENRDREDL